MRRQTHKSIKKRNAALLQKPAVQNVDPVPTVVACSGAFTCQCCGAEVRVDACQGEGDALPWEWWEQHVPCGCGGK